MWKGTFCLIRSEFFVSRTLVHLPHCFALLSCRQDFAHMLTISQQIIHLNFDVFRYRITNGSPVSPVGENQRQQVVDWAKREEGDNGYVRMDVTMKRVSVRNAFQPTCQQLRGFTIAAASSDVSIGRKRYHAKDTMPRCRFLFYQLPRMWGAVMVFDTPAK